MPYNRKQCSRHGRFIPILALTAAGCLWGTGFFFGKVAPDEMSVATMVLFRFAFACAGPLPFIFFDRPRFAAVCPLRGAFEFWRATPSPIEGRSSSGKMELASDRTRTTSPDHPVPAFSIGLLLGIRRPNPHPQGAALARYPRRYGSRCGKTGNNS